jgi:dCMP deaminase
MIKNISYKWHHRFMDKAKAVATYSKDPNVKVGAVLIGADKETISDGYNGFPRGTIDSEHLYSDEKYVFDNMVHAEMNAVANAIRVGSGVYGSILYCTRPPCGRCTGFLKQCGISAIVCLEQPTEYWKDKSLSDLLKRYQNVGIPFYMLGNLLENLVYTETGKVLRIRERCGEGV